MNKKEREILNIEQSFKDTLENELVKQNKENKRTKIKDVKYAGKVTWKDKINGKTMKNKGKCKTRRTRYETTPYTGRRADDRGQPLRNSESRRAEGKVA